MFSVLLMILAVCFSPRPSSAKDEKLKPEELVAKHLDSIGSAEKRAAAKSRATSGSTQVIFRVGGTGTLTGKGNILSQGSSIRAGFNFPALEYPGEQLAFDGNKVTAGQMSPGNYPPFSNFIYQNDVLIKEGLLFGTLTTAWALLDTPTRKPKLEYNGLKKIEGRQLHELRYSARTSKGGVMAFLYFDTETFRHVRSVFKLETPATQISKITDSAEMVRYQILETFDQFKQVDGLMLPHSYKLDFTIDAPRGAMFSTWTHIADRIAHNESVEAKIFSVQ